VFLGGVGGGQFQAAERAIRGGGSAAGMAVGDAGRGTIDEVGVDSDRGCVMAGRHGHGQQKIVTGGSERRRATAIACAAQSGPLRALGVHGHGAWWDEGGVAAVVDAPSEWGNPTMAFGEWQWEDEREDE
jgi:hypothetical protein